MLSISKMKINELISRHTVPEIWASKKLVTGPNGIMVAPKRRVTSLVSIHYEEVILK